MRCLLVVDMQEEYVGKARNIKRYPYQTEKLINQINNRIADYNPDNVIYVVNRFLWELNRRPKKLIPELFIVSDNIFEKRRASCFSNKRLIDFLNGRAVDEIELVGVDGNYCVGSTALCGEKEGFRMIFNESCVGIGNYSKFNKTKCLLLQNDIVFIS